MDRPDHDGWKPPAAQAAPAAHASARTPGLVASVQARADRLALKLFLAIAAGNALLAALAYLVFSLAFNDGFVDYVSRADQARVDTFAAALAAGYRREGGWAWAASNPQRWQDLYREGLGMSRLVRAGGDGDARSYAVPPNPAREFPLTIEPRLLLFDAERHLVAGREDLVDRAVLKAIVADGERVGFIGYVPRPQFIESIQRVFFAQQQGKFAALAGGMLLAGLIVAAALSYSLTRRIRTLARGTAALMQGDYDMRLQVAGHDELAQLANDFNRLAETLAAARRARQQWIADIAHELRTPLAVLRGEIEALQDGVRPLSPQSVASLAQETGRLGRLVEDLHLLSRSDLGALSYYKEPVDPAGVIGDVLEPQLRALAEQGIALDFAPRSGGMVMADENRLAQVFGNLLQNTLRYTDRPGTLAIAVRREEGDVVVDWQDSAPGVPEEDLPRLTDRLYRVERSRSSAGGGSGLGLAIVKAIVEAHHGTMTPRASALGGLHWELRFPAAEGRTSHG